ncbi:MAG: hypothetical protein Q9220_004410 [cf. Caloplaca sp. 1 TL-2023]
MDRSGSEIIEDGAGLQANQRSNALFNKITKLLSVSYADSEIRDALRLLDLKKFQNTPDTRRRLHLELQKDVIDRNSNIVRDFGQVSEQLKRVGSTISRLNACCKEVRQQVAAARQENTPVLDEALTLLSQKEDLEKQKRLLDAFNQHFILPEPELTILTSSSETIDETFFAVLSRTKQIHSDCKVLLGSENQRLGLELMDQTSRQLNIGYQKLYRWTNEEFEASDLENPQISAFIRKSLRTLAERPALFESCLDNFSEAREHVLTDGFYAALTGSSSKQNDDLMLKPIEFHAHDTLRYIGDILAWAHSATVSERESLESLFISEGEEMAKGIRAGRQSEPWAAIDGESFDGRTALHSLVNRNMSGVARALRQRIEQAIQGQDDSVTIYKIAVLVSFYRMTFSKLLGQDSSVMGALSELEASSMRQFNVLQTDQIATAQAEFAQVPPDLKVPDVLGETLSQLNALMKTYDSSLTATESREEGFLPIITSTLTPILSACEILATKSLDTPARHIFLLNCHLAAKQSLQPFSFTQSSLDHLTKYIDSSASELTEYQHAFFLHVSGLHPLLVALHPLNTDTREELLHIHTLPPFRPAALSQASQILDEFLPSALIDALDNLKDLKDTAVAGDVTDEAAGRFCEDFEFVEGVLGRVDEVVAEGVDRGEESESEDGEGEGGGAGKEEEVVKGRVLLRSLYPRTSGEIRVLLS